jgi:two-component system, LuxR family, response regulator FixJ
MIFVVDDDAATRDSISLLLECEALTVEAFSSCDALCRAADPQAAECLILDVHMRGTTGLELLEKLRSLGATLPIILMTGGLTADIHDRAIAAAATAVVEKPFGGNDLVEAVTSALTAHKSPGASL